MGGYGSGPRRGQPTYESTGSLVLSMSSFTRGRLDFGLHGAANLTFRCDGELFPVRVDFDTRLREAPHLELAHTRRSDPPLEERYLVNLATSPQPFGGHRWWFICPRTGHRAVRLFLPRGAHQFWSRHAYRLGYACQREDRMSRIQRRGLKLYYRLGGDRDGNWLDGAPPKPHGMRWATYERTAAELEFQMRRYDQTWLVGASRLLARFRPGR